MHTDTDPSEARDAALARLACELAETAQREASRDRTDRIGRLLAAMALIPPVRKSPR